MVEDGRPDAGKSGVRPPRRFGAPRRILDPLQFRRRKRPPEEQETLRFDIDVLLAVHSAIVGAAAAIEVS